MPLLLDKTTTRTTFQGLVVEMKFIFLKKKKTELAFKMFTYSNKKTRSNFIIGKSRQLFASFLKNEFNRCYN